MIIGIFGDSFAAPMNESSWGDILKNDYLLNIKNYARVCTTTFWSYQKLLSHINNIDVIIFSLTDPDRLYHSDDRYHDVCTLYTAQYQLENQVLTLEESMIFESAKQYHIYLSDPVFNRFVQDQLVKEIKHLARTHDKRLIIIPGFPSTVHYQRIFEISLFEIGMKEIRVNFNDNNYRRDRNKIRPNHMSKENNKILAAKIAGILNGETIKITLDDFLFTKYDDPEQHWEIG